MSPTLAAAPPSLSAAAVELIRATYTDPGRFVRSIIGATPDPWQDDALRTLVANHRVAIAGCNGAGKDTLAVWAALWFLGTRPFPRGIVIGPNERQTLRTVWPEAKKWIDGSPILSSLLDWQATRIMWRDVGRQRLSARAFLEAATAAKRYSPGSGDAAAEGLQGLHGEHVIVILTESSGIDDVYWDAAESCCTLPENYILAVGNPLRRAGRFYDLFTKPVYKTWLPRHIAYTDCSHVDRALMERWITMYGAESAFCQARVFGRFPSVGAIDAALGWELVVGAMGRVLDDCSIWDGPFIPSADTGLKKARVRIQLGVDVARFGGDESTIGIRVGNEVLPLRAWRGLTGPQLCGHILAAVRDVDGGPDTLIVVDEAGLGGAGVVDPLRQIHRMRNVVGVSNAWTADLSDRYQSWDDEQWMETLRDFATSGRLPQDDVLLAQLTTRRYEFTGRNEQQRRLEDKASLRRRGLASPDRAEAVMLACARGPSLERVAAQGGRRLQLYVV